MNTINISDAAASLDVSVKTMQRWDRTKRLVAGRTATGRRFYTHEQLRRFRNIPPESARKTVVYCRVSAQAQKPDLKNQRRVLEDFCIAKAWSGVEFIEEVGGGLNFKRKQFLQLMDDIQSGLICRVLIAHKDRLARFGFPLLAHICEQHECELVVLNSEQLSPEQEMVQDLMTIVHCFSSRLYGLRNYKKTLKGALAK